MDPQHFPVHDHQSQIFNNPTRSLSTGGLTERTPLTPYDLGLHHHVDPSFLSCFTTPPLPHLPTSTAHGPLPDNGCVVLDALPPENEESYARGWYSGFTAESWTAKEAESKLVKFDSFSRDMAYAASKRPYDSVEFTILVANLADEVTDCVLEETFKSKYTSVKGARIVTDTTTGRSKGYAVVRFANKDEMMRSLTEMNGKHCLTRPMRVGAGSTGHSRIPEAIFQSNPSKTTVGNFEFLTQYQEQLRIFVGGLDSNVTEEDLRQVFSRFGELSHVEIHVGKRCGIVQFVNRACAEEAMVKLHGIQLGGSNIRLSWARSPSNEQGQMVQQDANPNQWPAAAGNMYKYDGSYADYGKILAGVFSFQGCGGPVYVPPQQHQRQQWRS
ncbi:hypothetical protein MKX03_016717 [Papaver bracteatum]|nr:hypothetical protein MKX03_016717 [Papaver bracteatum]